jgi:hypothetical protein
MRLLLLLAMIGCVRTVPVRTPVLVTPSCDVPNAFEKCKVMCLDAGKRPSEAWEDANKFECHCVPFDAYNMPLPWRTPGPHKLARRFV